MLSEFLYVTKTSTYDDPVDVHHRSMSEVERWVVFNNMVLDFGNDRVYIPYFTIEHVDGSPLSSKELDMVRGFANEKSRNRRSYLDESPSGGLKHSFICKLARKLKKQTTQ